VSRSSAGFESHVFLNCPFDRQYEELFRGILFCKACLILDAEPYRCQKFISDIAGQDIKSHTNDAHTAVRVVRDWLRSVNRRGNLPGGAAGWHDYSIFRQEIPALLSSLQLRHDELTFQDYTSLIALWLKDRVVHGELQE
jgi:hypothetical protein